MSNGERWDKRWPVILIFLGLITVISILDVLGLGVVFPPPQPPAPRELIVEDEHWAAWMPIDNGFTQGYAYDYWNGVLFQLGRYVDEAGDEVAAYHHLTVYGSQGTKPLNRGDFTWMNIVSHRPGKNPPMSLEYVGLLYPDAGTTTECDMYDACAGPYPQSGTTCVCANPPCEEADLELIPSECMRLRSMHSHFVPEAVITYWQGDKGYKLEAVQEARGGTHNEYTFTLKDPVELEVYKDDTLLDLGVGQVRKIIISGPPDVDHDEIIDPGLDGGKFGS